MPKGQPIHRVHFTNPPRELTWYPMPPQFSGEDRMRVWRRAHALGMQLVRRADGKGFGLMREGSQHDTKRLKFQARTLAEVERWLDAREAG